MPKSRKYKPKRGYRKKSQINYLTLNLFIVPLFVVIFLVTYMAFQFLGERLQISPVIILGSWTWMTPGEAIILFVFFLGLSIVITANLVYFLLNKVWRI